jgi:nucleotide-binding universal stress UspA family protein
MLEKILVPIDGTAGSEKALPYAIGLARALGSELVLCHVTPSPGNQHTSPTTFSPRRYVNGTAERLRALELKVSTVLPSGDPAVEINKAAVDCDADAIVMATRGRRRLEKLVLGSVADAVVRDSRLPVLLVSSRKQLRRGAWQDAAPASVTQLQSVSVGRMIRRNTKRSA